MQRYNKNLQSNKQDFVVSCVNYNLFRDIKEPYVIQRFLDERASLKRVKQKTKLRFWIFIYEESFLFSPLS